MFPPMQTFQRTWLWGFLERWELTTQNPQRPNQATNRWRIPNPGLEGPMQTGPNRTDIAGLFVWIISSQKEKNLALRPEGPAERSNRTTKLASQWSAWAVCVGWTEQVFRNQNNNHPNRCQAGVGSDGGKRGEIWAKTNQSNTFRISCLDSAGRFVDMCVLGWSVAFQTVAGGEPIIFWNLQETLMMLQCSTLWKL